MYEKSQHTIAQILDAAQDCFVSHSYDDITMTAIAQAAAVTKGAIYYHFSSKEDLFLAMMQRYCQALEGLLAEAVALAGSAFERMTHLTTLFLKQPLRQQRLIQLVRRDAGRFTGTSREQLIRAYQAALPEQIEKIIAAGISSGELTPGDPRLLSWQYVAIVEVCLSDYARRQYSGPAEMAADLTTLFFAGASCRAVAVEG